METKIFKLPTNPITNKEQQIIVEKPEIGSVWYLITEQGKSVPLVNLKNPKTAKQVMEVIEKQIGINFIEQFVVGGFSKL